MCASSVFVRPNAVYLNFRLVQDDHLATERQAADPAE